MKKPPKSLTVVFVPRTGEIRIVMSSWDRDCVNNPQVLLRYELKKVGEAKFWNGSPLRRPTRAAGGAKP